MAAPYTAILRQLSPERFAALLEPLNRQSKEQYFARHQIRPPKQIGSGWTKPGHKNQVRAAKLHQVLQQLDDEPLAEELMRLYLLHRRTMLAAALDHLGIEHEDGLTDSEELGRFHKLSQAERKKLVEHLTDAAGTAASAEDAQLYIDFMAISTLPEPA